MKNHLSFFIFSVVLLISMVSCNNDSNTNTSEIKFDSVPSKKVIELSEHEALILNRFFTSFSEIYLPEFSNKQVSDSVLIQFGVHYNYRHNYNAFKQIKASSQASISEKVVADTAFKFMGVTIKKHRSIDEIEFKNKNYIIDNADGEAYRFSQVLEMTDLGNNLYSATIEIFIVGSGFTGDINASPETWNSDENEEGIPDSEGKMKAIIRKIEGDGNVRYVLVEYLKN